MSDGTNNMLRIQKKDLFIIILLRRVSLQIGNNTQICVFMHSCTIHCEVCFSFFSLPYAVIFVLNYPFYFNIFNNICISIICIITPAVLFSHYQDEGFFFYASNCTDTNSLDEA